MEVASRAAGVQPLSSASAAAAEEPAAAVEITASADQQHSDDREAADGIAATDAASDPFAIDPVTSALLEFVQSLADGEISGADVTPQQASVLRFLVTRPWRRRSQSADAAGSESADAAAEPARKLLHALHADPSPASASRFQAALAPLVSGQLSLESRCRSSQLEEVEALRSIFGGDARELVVYQTHPVTLKVAVQAEEMVDCRVEVGCAMPPDYPEKEALHVCAFVPPPFQGLRIAVDAEGKGNAVQDATARDGSEDRMVPVEVALQALLERRAAELALDGECAIFTLVEETRAFLVQHSEALRAALVARDGGLAAEGAAATESHSSSSAASPSSVVVGDAPLQLHPVTLWGRGRIERLESAAIRDVQLACDLPESLARAALREARWDVQAAIASQRRSAAADDATASASDAMPSSMRPILRQDSLPDRARFALLQEALSPFLSDPQRTLECGACGDTMQLRESAGQICTHLLCVACWRRMLATHIAAGEAFIHCPGYRCGSQVEEGLILALAPTPTHYARYRRWLQNNFIQLRGWRWCSNPRCDRVVATSAETDPSAVVACDCLAQWCLSCGGEGHWPASCAFTRRYGSAPLVTLVRQAEETRPPPPPTATPSTVVFAVEMSLDCKPCPKCATLWFRDGGCDHITCRKCGWNYCMRCLRPYPHQSGCGPEVPMTQLLFTEGGEEGVGGAAFTADDSLNTFKDAQGKTHIKIDDVNLIEQLQGGWRSIEESKGQVVELPRFVRREAGHYLSNRRLLRLLRLLETTTLPVASGSRAPAVSSSGSSSSSSSSGDGGDSADQAELNALLADLDVGPAQRHTLATLLAFLRQCHGLLHGCCMFLAVHNGQLADSQSSPRLRRSGARLLAALSQLDYFTRALDETLMPSPGMRRSLRTLSRMHGADRPSALKCAVALREALADFRDQVAASGLAGGLEKQLWAELAQIATAITLTSPTAADNSKAQS